MIESSEWKWIEALKKTEIEAPVRELYARYFEAIVTQVCVNGGSREDGADIFQESVIVLIDKVKSGSFRGDSSIRTFLSAIARNLWLTEMRTRERRKKREQWYTEVSDTALDGQAEEIGGISPQRLSAVLSGIGEVCRNLLTGFYYHRKSMRELLDTFHYENEQVLRNKKSKCMKKLKEMLTASPEVVESLKPQPLYE